MTPMQSEVFEAFRSIDIPQDNALNAAGALAKRDDGVAGFEAELRLMTWMLGFALALRIAIALKLFIR
jgi:hypothetical protein